MEKQKAYGILALRLVMGWIMFYAGITNLLTPSWTAAGFLNNAVGPFSTLFKALAGNVIVDQLVMWGLTLIGIALLLGAVVKIVSSLAIVMMILFYLPYFPPEHGIVDYHVVYAVAFALLIIFDSGRFFGIDSRLKSLRIVKKHSWWV